LLIGDEVRPTEFVADRIDLLAVDQQGAAVVMELKRGSDKLQLLQALSYASMIADWDAERLVGERTRFAGKSAEEAEEEIEQFLLEDIGELNGTQRIVLLANDYDYEVLVTAKWLNENYGVDIRCYRMGISVDEAGEFMSCTCIYPPPEITQHVVLRRSSKGCATSGWTGWDTALAACDNDAIVAFFREELVKGHDEYLADRALIFRIGNKRRFWIHVRRHNAYVWQIARFPDDEGFWRKHLGPGADIPAADSEHCLRFYLNDEEDCRRFRKAFDSELRTVEFS